MGRGRGFEMDRHASSLRTRETNCMARTTLQRSGALSRGGGPRTAADRERCRRAKWTAWRRRGGNGASHTGCRPDRRTHSPENERPWGAGRKARGVPGGAETIRRRTPANHLPPQIRREPPGLTRARGIIPYCLLAAAMRSCPAATEPKAVACLTRFAGRSPGETSRHGNPQVAGDEHWMREGPCVGMFQRIRGKLARTRPLHLQEAASGTITKNSWHPPCYGCRISSKMSSHTFVASPTE
ncbi:hypothetical protein TSACC_2923 [Terrimicrobium sacchariphilum]|uniref:Uncharacterized protein n=1 Tax=Terrimicrobium sacchariphilum TaxID=690879 RepID=A0A146G6F8_TERSA|nr:hypothetical protein TSACC_2923 [Terrimicrobium sacchariphilum]